jgi:hypothetical protein
MGYNKRKTARLEYEHHDKMLEKQRAERGHNKEKSGTYNKILDEDRKGSEEISIHQKQLEKHHREASESPRIVEKWFEDENKRDDSTHKTNTLPINELAEEAQRRRMKYRGDGDGFVKDHFQDYKKESKNLFDQNYGKLSGVMSELDKLWMASSWNRLTTSEKKQVTALREERDCLVKQANDLFQTDDQVQVTGGDYIDLVGQIISKDEVNETAKVQITIFGHTVEVEVPLIDLEKYVEQGYGGGLNSQNAF